VTKGKTTASKRRFAWGRYLLVFFLAAWMFVLGVLVGRGTAPVHFDTQALQKELVAMRDAMAMKQREAVEKAVRGEDEKAPLGFYEALKKDGPDTHVQLPVSPESMDSPDTAAQRTDAPKPPHKTRAAVMPKRSTVALKPAADTAPSKPPAAAVGGRLTIQVASLKDPAAARRIVANLKKEGYAAYLSRIVIANKGIWFRVRIGSYTAREQAAADMNRLTRRGRKPILVEK
jgi:DedD protein